MKHAIALLTTILTLSPLLAFGGEENECWVLRKALQGYVAKTTDTEAAVERTQTLRDAMNERNCRVFYPAFEKLEMLLYKAEIEFNGR